MPVGNRLNFISLDTKRISMNQSYQLISCQPTRDVFTTCQTEVQEGNARIQAYLQERFTTTLSDYQHLFESLINADSQQQVSSAMVGYMENRVAYSFKAWCEMNAICLEYQTALMRTIQQGVRGAQP
jgi:hypothetical protein